MRPLIVFGVFLTACFVLSAQQIQTNDSVVKLTKMGFSPEVIATTINRSPEAFDISPAGLARLKDSGVAPLVIAAMIASTVVAPPSLPAQRPTTVDAAATRPVTEARTAANKSISSFAAGRLEVKVIDRRDKQERYEYSAVYAHVRIGKSYLLRGATFTLQLPDGRLVIANCETKFAEKMRGPAGNRRSCRMPLIETFEVDFKGDNAKLFWPVSIDGSKMQSESYRIIGILNQPRNN